MLLLVSERSKVRRRIIKRIVSLTFAYPRKTFLRHLKKDVLCTVMLIQWNVYKFSVWRVKPCVCELLSVSFARSVLSVAVINGRVRYWWMCFRADGRSHLRLALDRQQRNELGTHPFPLTATAAPSAGWLGVCFCLPKKTHWHVIWLTALLGTNKH